VDVFVEFLAPARAVMGKRVQREHVRGPAVVGALDDDH
jgi:hypothetical protein